MLVFKAEIGYSARKLHLTSSKTEAEMSISTSTQGVFALDWGQTEIDGVIGLGLSGLRIGASWAWHGKAVRLDAGAAGPPQPDDAAQPALRRRARAIAARLVGLPQRLDADFTDDGTAPAHGFVLTDGITRYPVRVVADHARRLVVFEEGMPPQGRLCWIIALDMAGAARAPLRQDVICFAADTLISTPQGPRALATLRVGDKVLTRDNGPQPVMWLGQTSLSGLALRRHAHLRPIRLRRGALLPDMPSEDLCVSPAHRILVQGRRAAALFGCDEVLVRAADLVDYRAIAPDLALHGVTYAHLLFESHQIIFANGVPCESFHPMLAPAETLRQHRGSLGALGGGWLDLPERYGPTVRRCLVQGEAALLAA
jgi:hypothetical protein